MIRDILWDHFERYPRMRAQDAVKLVYQCAFGPGHLIKSPEKALAAIREEMAGLGEPLPGEKLYEGLGGGLCRLNLRPCAARGIQAEDICGMLLEAANGTPGDKKAFREGLRELRDMAEAGETPFDAVELDLFLIQYDEKGCPHPRHSEEYRAAYRPAYRVVIQKRVKEYLAKRRETNSKT